MTPAANLPALRRLLEGGHDSDLCISGFIVRHRGLSAMRNLMSKLFLAQAVSKHKEPPDMAHMVDLRFLGI